MLLVALALAACGAPAEDVDARASSAAITKSEEDPGDDAVVALILEQRGRRPHLLCSGVVISPRIVVTAAHCLNDLGTNNLERSPLRIVLGSDVTRPRTSLRAIAANVHPDYYHTPLAPHDLATLVLERSVPVPPITLATQELETPDIGAPVRLVGFGGTDPADPGGRKRFGTAVLDEIDDTRFLVRPGPSLTCSHDSGAPALLTRADVEELVGVTVSGFSDCSNYSRFTRIDVYRDDFILPAVDAAASLPETAPPNPISASGGCQLARSAAGTPWWAYVLTGALGAMRRKARRSVRAEAKSQARSIVRVRNQIATVVRGVPRAA